MRDEAKIEIKDYALKLVRQAIKIDVQNHEGVTPLQQAAALGYPDLLEVFLNCGAPVNKKTTTGWTTLHSAVASGNAECVEMFLERNVQVNILGTLPSMIRLPRFSWPARTPLHIAISQRYNTIVSLLIAAGADVNATDGDQKTPLQLAIDINNLEAVKLLRDNGAISDLQ
jgi:ankyrin repeat protein